MGMFAKEENKKQNTEKQEKSNENNKDNSKELEKNKTKPNISSKQGGSMLSFFGKPVAGNVASCFGMCITFDLIMK